MLVTRKVARHIAKKDRCAVRVAERKISKGDPPARKRNADAGGAFVPCRWLGAAACLERLSLVLYVHRSVHP